MRDLLGRLGAVDPDAGEAFRVITYFDTLVEQRAGLEAMVRGAAVLSGCSAVLADASGKAVVKVDSRGRRLTVTGEHDDPEQHPGRIAVPPSSTLWLEREGEPRANDQMILERCAVGLQITLQRIGRRSDDDTDEAAAEILLDSGSDDDARLRALHRLGLDEHWPLVVVAAVWVPSTPAGPRSVVRSTAVGLIRASIRHADRDHIVDVRLRLGVGRAGPASALPRSWAEALTALRMTTSIRPIRRWEEIGALVALVDGIDAGAQPHPDELAVGRVLNESWGLATADAVCETESVRAAAQRLGLHHSTVQTRVERIAEMVGFSPTSPSGRSRLTVALTAHTVRSFSGT